jgi:hypothetical protein
VALDWGIGTVDGDGLYTYGSPYQLFSTANNIYGTPIVDGRVLARPERLAGSSLTGAPRAVYASDLHFKHPNI